jgi:hypothetical protein
VSNWEAANITNKKLTQYYKFDIHLYFVPSQVAGNVTMTERYKTRRFRDDGMRGN